MEGRIEQCKNGKKKTVPIVTVAIIFLLFIVFFIYKIVSATKWEIENKEILFTVELKQDEKIQIIKPLFTDNILYFLLPACAESCETTLHFDSPFVLTFDGKLIHNNTEVNKFEREKEYDIRINGFQTGKIVFMYGDHLPAMFISTESGGIEWLCENKDNKEAGVMTLVNADGTVEYDGNLDWISGRGNTTWNLDKKPWTVKLENKTSLLGMNESNKWILLANSFDDTAGLRNYIAYNMAIDFGMEYSRHLEFINLYLNEEYYGLFLLTEKIEISGNQLNIGNLEKRNKTNNEELYEANDIDRYEESLADGSYRKWAGLESPEDITGGYILERSYGSKLTDKESFFITPKGEGFVIRDPELVSEEESEYIFEVMSSVERTLENDDYVDPETGKPLSEIIDFDSWILKYLVDEITKNEGAGTTSSYFYKKQGDSLVYAGPVWDYDKSLGNYSYWMSPGCLTLCQWHRSSSEWWGKLYGNEIFKTKLLQYYKEKAHPYIERLIQIDLDNCFNMLCQSHVMNYIRWKDMFVENKSHSRSNLQFYLCDLQKSVDYLKEWLQKRLEFLDSVWYNNTDYCNLFIMKDDHGFISVPIVRGTVVDSNFWYEIEPCADHFCCFDTGELFDTSKPIVEDTYIYAVVLEEQTKTLIR